MVEYGNMDNFEGKFEQPPNDKENKTDIPESAEASDYREENDEKKQEEQDSLGEQKKQERLESRRFEREVVTENPEFVGMNLDQDYIVDGRSFWSQERWLQYIKERDGQISEEALVLVESGKAQEIITEKQVKENDKIKDCDEYISSFEGNLKHIRINPAGETSPASPSQAIETRADGTYETKINPKFIEQARKLKEQCSDLTLVVPFYDHRRGKERASDVPETQEQVEQYIAICEKMIESIGDGVQLEIGNEANVSRSTGAMFADKLQHASHVNPTEYGRFFFEVAKKIKEKTPAAKLSIAGVACFDPTYLREVLTEVRRLQIESGKDTTLVDTISFHPYRENPNSGSIEVKNGNFTINELDYERQMEKMQKIASQFGVNINIGEINFPLSDKEQKTKLKQAVSLTAKRGITSLIYPGNNVH